MMSFDSYEEDLTHGTTHTHTYTYICGAGAEEKTLDF